MSLKVHAIIIALNEEDFIAETLKPLYPHCSGLSVITQYDRDYHLNRVQPDLTVQKVLQFPDPEGKIHLVVRRYIDETASRNHEMLSLLTHPEQGVLPHAWSFERVREFHACPDYFLIVDADEIYDAETFPAILDYLARQRPAALKMQAFEYGPSWRFRVPPSHYLFKQFGFVRAGRIFESRRTLSWNEHRLNKLFSLLHMGGNWGTRLLGYQECPQSVGMFHHGAIVRRGRAKLLEKMTKHSHQGEYMNSGYLRKILAQKYEIVPLENLPRNLLTGTWPACFWEDNLEALIGSLMV